MVQNVGCLKENTYLCNRKSEKNALLAQLVEQLTLNQWVRGSNPRRCTILLNNRPSANLAESLLLLGI